MSHIGDLDPAEFADFLADAGTVPLIYYRYSGRCPRSVSRAGGFQHPDPTCPLCSGTGILLERAPVPINNPSGGGLLLQAGRVGRSVGNIVIEAGDLVCDYLPEDYSMVSGDRFVFPTYFDSRTELVTRGESLAPDVLQGRPVLRIERVTGQSGVIAAGFRVSDDLTGITWDGSAGNPAANTDYSAVYSSYTQYGVPLSVTEDARPTDDEGRALPRSIVLKQRQMQATDSKPGQF